MLLFLQAVASVCTKLDDLQARKARVDQLMEVIRHIESETGVYVCTVWSHDSTMVHVPYTAVHIINTLRTVINHAARH